MTDLTVLTLKQLFELRKILGIEILKRIWFVGVIIIVVIIILSLILRFRK